MILKNLLIILAVTVFSSGCSYQVISNAVIQKQAVEALDTSKLKGVEVEGKVYYPYLIGYNFQESIDQAFAQAGEGYDIIVNAKVDTKYYYGVVYFSKYVFVTGTAIKSSEVKASMGEEGYTHWLAGQNIISKEAP